MSRGSPQAACVPAGDNREASHPAPRCPGLLEVTATDPLADGVAEVARLAATIADRILEQHAAGRTIAPVQFTMLVGAARMLLDNGAPWPPSVEQVLMAVAQRIAHAEAPGEAP